ncbi:unnamed protein product [Polarella glacialis]|uniref:Uncharacterized protein n=1 Tax=Polarella glacialis TaxID=89957 RepID=A0A813KXK9_POLGL|nr:unnamed protein product [Polarella glacialis]
MLASSERTLIFTNHCRTDFNAGRGASVRNLCRANKALSFGGSLVAGIQSCDKSCCGFMPLTSTVLACPGEERQYTANYCFKFVSHLTGFKTARQARCLD